MRLFIAIQPNEDAVRHLRELQADIRKSAPKAGHPKGFHLTLKFLGEIGCLDKVTAALEKVSFKPFEFSLAQTGAFPDWRRPRVIWTGVEPIRPILELQQQIDKHLAEAGFPSERKFHPHITLERVRHSADKDYYSRIAEMKVNPIATEVRSFSLIKSDLLPQGPSHTALRIFHAK